MNECDPQTAQTESTPLVETIGLIGVPIAHSLSPAIQNAACAALGLPWRYVGVECREEEMARSVIEGSKGPGFVGLNITMPYKELAAEMADELDASAKRAGGANVLSYAGGVLKGYNTDGAGIVGALKWQADTEVAGKTCLVCGTGPAARSALLALLDGGCSAVFLASRNADRSADLARAVADDRIVPVTYEGVAETMRLCDIIVDATSVGMKPGEGSVLPAEGFDGQHVLVDVVYAHGKTQIVADAEAAGARAFDGLGMLIEQGALSLEIWLRDQGYGEVEVSRQMMMQAALEELARREIG